MLNSRVPDDLKKSIMRLRSTHPIIVDLRLGSMRILVRASLTWMHFSAEAGDSFVNSVL
jgi:hypothetical protein